MERRTVSQRRPRRARVQFWKRGEAEATTGFTSNVSTSGMFVGTNTPLPRGTRLRIEVMEPPGLFLEGVVAHAVKVAPGLQRVRQSGMGIRFLRGDEILAELLAPPPPPPPKAPPVPEPEPVEIEQGPPKNLVYPVRFADPQQFVDTFRSDLRNGGIFVITKFPAPLNAKVTVEIVPPGGEATVRLAGVVTSVRSLGEASRTTEPPGMGVLFHDPQEVIAKLLPAIAQAQEGKLQG